MIELTRFGYHSLIIEFINYNNSTLEIIWYFICFYFYILWDLILLLLFLGAPTTWAINNRLSTGWQPFLNIHGDPWARSANLRADSNRHRFTSLVSRLCDTLGPESPLLNLISVRTLIYCCIVVKIQLIDIYLRWQ